MSIGTRHRVSPGALAVPTTGVASNVVLHLCRGDYGVGAGTAARFHGRSEAHQSNRDGRSVLNLASDRAEYATDRQELGGIVGLRVNLAIGSDRGGTGGRLRGHRQLDGGQPGVVAGLRPVLDEGRHSGVHLALVETAAAGSWSIGELGRWYRVGVAGLRPVLHSGRYPSVNLGSIETVARPAAVHGAAVVGASHGACSVFGQHHGTAFDEAAQHVGCAAVVPCIREPGTAGGTRTVIEVAHQQHQGVVTRAFGSTGRSGLDLFGGPALEPFEDRLFRLRHVGGGVYLDA